jgi:hypothetical protein
MLNEDSKGPGSNMIFAYWDDLGDSQEHVDAQKSTPCSNHARQMEEDLLEERLANAEWDEKEEEWNARMNIIGQNGNTGEHYEDTGDDIN